MDVAGAKSKSRPDMTALFGEAGPYWEIRLKSVLELLTGASGRNSVSSQVVKIFIIGAASRAKLHTLDDEFDSVSGPESTFRTRTVTSYFAGGNNEL
jgi:hypothetical protein